MRGSPRAGIGQHRLLYICETIMEALNEEYMYIIYYLVFYNIAI